VSYSIQRLQTKVKDERNHQQCTKNHSAHAQEQARSLSKDDRNIKAATYKVSSRLMSSTEFNIYIKKSKQFL